MKISLARVLKLFTDQLAAGNEPGSSPMLVRKHSGQSLAHCAWYLYYWLPHIIGAHDELSTTNLRANHDRVAFARRDCEALGPAEPHHAIPAER